MEIWRLKYCTHGPGHRKKDGRMERERGRGREEKRKVEKEKEGKGEGEKEWKVKERGGEMESCLFITINWLVNYIENFTQEYTISTYPIDLPQRRCGL